ncbi:hypothetical protein KIPB_004118 [Kipferlia bialata]|uniref:Uncharacterized protein n=1 Tax=Kipferlia bialata TaxID=797122 RepID=A0A391NNC8_9EUKA|nr:hypothetical protein KIPB_004118 [Kipferlia bialata]|eukprot:g4118.t1
MFYVTAYEGAGESQRVGIRARQQEIKALLATLGDKQSAEMREAEARCEREREVFTVAKTAHGQAVGVQRECDKALKVAHRALRGKHK